MVGTRYLLPPTYYLLMVQGMVWGSVLDAVIRRLFATGRYLPRYLGTFEFLYKLQLWPVPVPVPVGIWMYRVSRLKKWKKRK